MHVCIYCIIVKQYSGSRPQSAAATTRTHDTNRKSQEESRIGALTKELEEAKQTLGKVKEENKLMAYSIKTLKQELEEAKKDLKQLKAKRVEIIDHPDHRHDDNVMEDFKFIETTIHNARSKRDEFSLGRHDDDYQRKRNVKFASPPSLAQVIVHKEVDEEEKMGTSVNKLASKKKSLMEWLFSSGGSMKKKKDGGHENKTQSPVRK